MYFPKTFGLLRVVLRVGDDSYRVLVENCDPRPVRKYYDSARRKYGRENVAIVNRDGYQTWVQRTGRGGTTRYSVATSFDVTNNGRMIRTLLSVDGGTNPAS